MSGNDEFQAFAGNYGALEAQMGQEAYQANVKNVESMAEHNLMQIELMKFRMQEDARINDSIIAMNNAKAIASGTRARAVSGALFLGTLFFILYLTVAIVKMVF